MPIAYSYHRFSHPRQVSKDKLWRQLQDARNYADRHKLILDEGLSFQDLGVSAFHGDNRETGRLGDFLTAVRHGFVKKGSYLLVESLDRLSRDTARRALRTLEDLCDEGIAVVTLIDNQVYTAERLDHDPTSLFISLVIFLRANEESLTKSRRQKAAWKRKIERARNGEKVIITKVVPSWIKCEGDEFVIDREKAKVVKLIFYLAELGIGAKIIANALNRNKCPTLRSAKFWRKDAVQVLLRNPAACGAHLPHFYGRFEGKVTRTPGEPIEGYYPKIVSKKSWQKVQRLLEERRCKHLKTDKSFPRAACVNLFGWLSKCPRCGSSMGLKKLKPGAQIAGGYGDFFVCSLSENSDDCDYVPVSYSVIEESFLTEGVAMMERHLADLKSSEPLTSDQFDVSEASLIEPRVAGIKELFEANSLDRPQLNRRLRILFKNVVINYSTNELEFNWLYGGRTKMPY